MSKHFITLALVLFSQLPVYGASPYNQTRSLVEKWVQTKKLVAQLKADWKEENEILNQSITALEREVSSVESAMGAVDKRSHSSRQRIRDSHSGKRFSYSIW